MNKVVPVFSVIFLLLAAVLAGAQTKPQLSEINFLVSGQSVDTTSFSDVTVELQFDSDMDSTKSPSVTFGLQEPFSQSVPEGSGWINRRLWQGFFTVSNNNPQTGDGLYIFKIFDGENASGVMMDTTLSTSLGKTLYICRSGKVVLSSTSLDFEMIAMGTTRSISLSITNPSCIALNVTGIQVTQPFYRSAATPNQFVVSPGQQKTISIVFDPWDRTDYSGTVTISSDDASQGEHVVQLAGGASGSRISLIANSPLDFGKVDVGQDSTRVVRVTNVAAESSEHDEDLVVSNISTNSSVYTTAPSSLIVGPGDTAQVSVTFTPVDRVNYDGKLLVFQHNDLTQSTRSIVLNGNARDQTPPTFISNLRPVWSGFNGFSRADYLPICWDNPNDPSGIAEIWWKFVTGENPPTSATDTTEAGGRMILAPNAICADLTLRGRLTSGFWNCYIWLVDGSGNSGYQNAVRTSFTYDINPPAAPVILSRSIPATRWFTHDPFTLTIQIPVDQSRGFRDASELRWKFLSPPVDGSDYYDNIVFSNANPESRTLTVPFESEAFCGADSLFIWLADSAGNASSENITIAKYSFDICPPDIRRVHADSSNIALLGAVFRDTLIITDHVGVDTGWVRYRFGGADAEEPTKPVKKIAGTPDRFFLEIPVAGVTKRGIEIRGVAIDSLGNQGEAPKELCDDDDHDEHEAWFPVRTRIAGEGDFRVDSDGRAVPLISGADSTNYQLVSIPYVLENNLIADVFEDDLGSYDNTQWRLFDYQTSQPENVRFVEGLNARPVIPGRSFFIIARKENIVVDSGPGLTNRTVCPDSIRVYEGWNLIATPYNFPVHRESLSLVHSETEISLRSFERGWNIVDVMEPWKGYALFVSKPNDQSGEIPMYLLVQPKAAPGRVSKQRDRTADFEADWSLRIEAAAESLHDRDNWVGVVQGAAAGYDRFELAEPPVIGEYLKVSFNHPEWGLAAKEFSTDLRPAETGEYRWDFQVVTNKRNGTVELNFDLAGAFPVDSEIFLVDESLKLSRNLRRDPRYQIKTGRDGLRKSLSLIVGSPEFALEQAGDIGLVPAEFQLLQNFPNPFNPETSIRFNLPRAGSVRLEVFDLLGRKVATLINSPNHEAGFHLAIWNGREDSGRPVASGVYVYRLQANGHSVVRKMILMK